MAAVVRTPAALWFCQFLAQCADSGVSMLTTHITQLHRMVQQRSSTDWYLKAHHFSDEISTVVSCITQQNTYQQMPRF